MTITENQLKEIIQGAYKYSDKVPLSEYIERSKTFLNVE